MITEATTTEDLIATLAHTRPLSEVSFEEGCTVLDAVEMFDRRCANGKLGTWLDYSNAGRNALRLAVARNLWDDPTYRREARQVCEKLAQDVVTWTCRQPGSSTLGTLFTVWVVIDRGRCLKKTLNISIFEETRGVLRKRGSTRRAF